MGKTDQQPASSGGRGGGGSGRKSPSLSDINDMRMSYCLAALTGREVRVVLENGSKIQGLFHAHEKKERKDRSVEGEFVLYCARELPAATRPSGEVKRQMHIPDKSVISLHAYDVPTATTSSASAGVSVSSSTPASCASAAASGGVGSFKTDTQISQQGGGKRLQADRGLTNGPASTRGGGAAGQPRELQKWVADDGRSGASCALSDDTFGSLEPTGSSAAAVAGCGGGRRPSNSATEWDQFAVNEQRFGVRSSFKEELYTTKLDLDAIPLQVQQQADRIATELEKQQQGNRDGTVDDCAEQDEEALFSAVSGTGGYAPHRRAAGTAPRGAADNSSSRSSARSSAASSGGGFGGTSSAAYPVASAHPKSSWGSSNVPSSLNNTGGANSASSVTTSASNSCLTSSGGASEQHQRNLKASGGITTAHMGHVAKVAGGALKELRENLENAAKENQKKDASKNDAAVPGMTLPNHKELHETHKKMRSILACSSPARVPTLQELGGINALNLEPALPKLDDQLREEWLNFKKTKNQQTHSDVERRDRAQDKSEFMNASKVFTQLLEKNRSPGGSSRGVSPKEDSNFAAASCNVSSPVASQSNVTSRGSGGLQQQKHATGEPISSGSDGRGPLGSTVARRGDRRGSISEPPSSGSGASTAAESGETAMGGATGTGEACGKKPGGDTPFRGGTSTGSKEGAQSSASASSFSTKKGFQFNPHANAFTPSTPSPHTAAASLCTPSSSSLHPSAYAGPHLPQSALGVPPLQPGVGHVPPQMHSGGGGIVTLPVVGVPGFPPSQNRAGGLPTTPRLAATPGGSSAPGLVVLAGGGRPSDPSLPPQQQHPPQNAPVSSISQSAGSEQAAGKPTQSSQNANGLAVSSRTGSVGSQPAPQVQAFPPFSAGHAAAGLPLAHWAGGGGVGGLAVPASQPPHGAGAPGLQPAGGSSHGLGGPGTAVLSDQQNQATGAMAGGLMSPGPGGALLPDGMPAAPVPLGVASFALNNPMAHMNMMGGSLVMGQTGQAHQAAGVQQRQHPHPHPQALMMMGNHPANVRLVPAGMLHPPAHAPTPSPNGPLQFSVFQALSSVPVRSSTGKGGRNSAASGSNQNKAGHLSDFLNTVLNKARHEKLVQVSPEWPGTGGESYRMILGQIPPTSIPQAASLPAAALGSPIAPFPILHHPQLPGPPPPGGPLFNIHPHQLLFPAGGPQAFIPGGAAPPGAMPYPHFLYPPLPLAPQHHVPPSLVSGPASPQQPNPALLAQGSPLAPTAPFPQPHPSLSQVHPLAASPSATPVPQQPPQQPLTQVAGTGALAVGPPVSPGGGGTKGGPPAGVGSLPHQQQLVAPIVGGHMAGTAVSSSGAVGNLPTYPQQVAGHGRKGGSNLPQGARNAGGALGAGMSAGAQPLGVGGVVPPPHVTGPPSVPTFAMAAALQHPHFVQGGTVGGAAALGAPAAHGVGVSSTSKYYGGKKKSRRCTSVEECGQVQ
ncbi:hypothetical protein CSUI_008476 [Cystoisospora suis]|uniref:LsmAD domain-containing protein n=1 Tax=Cystoisospora suis TaxID=483139 RepID=A0A2C6K945_9APIC|nr:hypothetical protein CSUI_008476 [Cystoisospora suis]